MLGRESGVRRDDTKKTKLFRRDHGIGSDLEFRRAEDLCEMGSTAVPNQRERWLQRCIAPRLRAVVGATRGLGQEGWAHLCLWRPQV